MNNANLNPEKSRGRWWLIISVLVLATGVLWVTWEFVGSAGRTSPTAGDSSPDQDASAAGTADDAMAAAANPFQDTLGIEVKSVSLSVGGTRLDVRYQVTDPNRAVQLTNKFYSACLLDSNGTRLRVPEGRMAPIQNQSGQKPRPGFVYSHFFPNPDGAVKPSDEVTLVIGNLRQPLTVQ